MVIIKKISVFLQKAYRHSISLILYFFVKGVSKEDFQNIYNDLKKEYILKKDSYNFDEFVMPKWKENLAEIEKYFLNDFSFSFLNYSVIKRTMFLHSSRKWKNLQKELVSEYFGKDDAKRIIMESGVGMPLLNDFEYLTSGNSIHHAYHLAKFFSETEVDFKKLNTIVEVGGGYGNMARIYNNMNKDTTYIIIDIPIFSFIQKLYLTLVLGSEKVNLIDDKLELKNNTINLVPLDRGIMQKISEKLKNTDLFISTWALSESNKNMQNSIKNLDYFNARYLLLAYQDNNKDFSFANNINDISDNYEKLYHAETKYTKNNYYLFCNKINLSKK